MLRTFIEQVVRFRWLACLVIVLNTAFLASQIRHLAVDMDPDIWSPQSHPFVQATKRLEVVFGGRNITVIGIVPRQGDIYQASVLRKISAIQQGIEQIPNAVRHNVISIAAKKVKSIKGTADALEARPMLEAIPATPEDMQRLREAVASNPVYVGTLAAADGRAAAVIADFKVDKDNPSLAKLHEDILAVVDPQRDASVDIHLGGVPIQLAWFEHHMIYMPAFFLAALLVLACVQYYFFRSLKGILLPMLTGLLSVVWALGAMGLTGVHMDGMNTTTPILIMAVASGHAIQILKRYYEALAAALRDRPQAWDVHVNNAAIVGSLGAVGPVMIVACLIASASFFSLAFSNISVVRHFGAFAGFGIVSAMLLELTLIPALRALLGIPGPEELAWEKKTGPLDRGLAWLAACLTEGSAPRLLLASLALIAVLVSGIFVLHIDNSLKRYNREDSVVSVDDAALNRRFAGTNSILVSVEGRKPDAIKRPDVLAAMARLQERLGQLEGVGKSQSIADFIKRMNQALYGEQTGHYRIPDSQAAVAQILLLYQTSGSPQDFDSFVDNDYQNAAIWVYVKEDSTAAAERLIQAIQAEAGSFPADVAVRIGGSLPQTIAVDEVIVREKLVNMAQMAAVVLVMSTALLRSPVAALFVVLPLLLNVVANIGLLGWLGIPLDMGTATSSAMAIGIGADYELYLLLRLKEEFAQTGNAGEAIRRSVATSGKAVLFTALSIGSGYAVLLLSDFAFYTRLSLMVISTMLVSAFSALIFLRAIIVVVRPRFAFGHAKAEPNPLST